MQGREPTRTQEYAHGHERAPGRQLRELVAALEHADDAPAAGVGFRVRLHQERERDGYGLGF